MPGRLRQSAGRTTVTTEAEGTYNIPGLEFNDPLAWRAGKAISVADLLDRLTRLGTELRGVEQGQIPATEFTKLANDLANANLLGHKDKGVRAWTLACIVDILNICAPDAPLRPAQLKDIFTVIVNTIIAALADPSNAYNSQHVYILNSLVDTKSIVLITDIQDADALIVSLFSICFDIVSGSGKNTGGIEVAKSVEFQLRSMLITIIDEANLPQEAVDSIISQFLRVDPRTAQESTSRTKKNIELKDKAQSTFLLKDYPPAYNMAKAICTTCPEKMTAHITQYFGAIIVNTTSSFQHKSRDKNPAVRAADSPSSDEESDSFNDLRKAHRLVRELWRACPDILTNVIPQLEAELASDSEVIRLFATETLGDVVAGIGLSGPPPVVILDPAAYPLPSVTEPDSTPAMTNPLLVPASPKPFAQVHPSAYQAFLGRRIDRSPSVRTAWTTAIARILSTNAGGIGLDRAQQTELLASLTHILRDVDEKVRVAAIEAVTYFSYQSVVDVLGSDDGISQPDSFISALAERVTDRKHHVREQAMLVLGRLWGVASQDIENGEERVVTVLGDIPTRLLSAMYTNDMQIHVMLDQVLYESLIPLAYPPIKAREAPKQKGSQRVNSSQDALQLDIDAIRVKRILTLVRGLDDRTKPVFFGMQSRQVDLAKAVRVFLKACEDYNGGVVDDHAAEERIKEQLMKFIEFLSRQQADPGKAAADLWKFAKMHDRRNYQLIRFAMGPESDYRTMTKAIKELTKRLREGASGTQSLVDSLMPLLYRCSLIVYNRSHVPAIMAISHSQETGLAEVAHELLKEISAKNPEVLKSHIQALCKELESNAPSADKPETPSSANNLKACSAFARKYPSEVPKDRKFLVAMINFALYSSSPRAAKHAVTIALTVSDKKELHAKEILTRAMKDCQSSSPHFLAQLAAISQVCLIVPSIAVLEEDKISAVVISNILEKNRSPSHNIDPNAWQIVPDDETIAKELALKILVNKCRSVHEKESTELSDTLAKTVLALLMRVVTEDGEISLSKDTPAAQKNHLRLVAARFILKLCSCSRRCEELVSPEMFISVALIVINPPNAVRTGFINQLKKYLGRNQLSHRWFTIFFLLAFEPDAELRQSTVAWLKSRVSYFARQQKQAAANGKAAQSRNILEMVFARLISLLAHHPDYPEKDSQEFDGELLDFAKYIVFYLQAVANEDNLSFIFHLAQRIKQTQDAVTGTPVASGRLYVLSDLAQATIRNFADLMPAHARGINLLQTWPGKAHLPITLFKALSGHTIALEIAEKNYLPEIVALGLEKLVRSIVKPTKSRDGAAKAQRKRKSSESVDPEDDELDISRKSSKKSKKSTILPIRRTPKAKRKSEQPLTEEQPSRKSARVSTTKSVNYIESDDDDENADDQTKYENFKQRSSPLSKKARKSPTPGSDAEVEEEEDHAEDEEVLEPTEEADNDEDIDMADDDNQDDAEAEKENATIGQGLDSADDEIDENESDEESEREATPSPLKENQNSRSTRARAGKGTAIAAATAKIGGQPNAKKEKKTKVPIAAKRGKKASKSSPAPVEVPATRRTTRSTKA